MATQFIKFKGNFPPKWAQYFHAGTDWLQAFEILEEERKKEVGIFLFWVYPHVLYFSLELFVKSLAVTEDPAFDAKKSRLGHSATAIIKNYERKIPIFTEIVQNQTLFNLIKEYEKTLYIRFGETFVEINGTDTNLMLETTYKLRGEMCKQTGLR